MQMRIIRQLSAACVAAAALAASANANAQNNDYHATIHSANWVFGNADNGGAAIIRADILHQTCNTFVQDFATHEMWYMTDESNLSLLRRFSVWRARAAGAIGVPRRERAMAKWASG